MNHKQFDNWLRCFPPEPLMNVKPTVAKLQPPKYKRLTQAALQDYIAWARWSAGDGCRCHLAAPCVSCTHPGNPINLNENLNAWEWDAIDLDEMVAEAQAAIRCTINRHARLHLQEMEFRKGIFESCMEAGKDPGTAWNYNKEIFNYTLSMVRSI